MNTDPKPQSSFGNISIRGWIALILVMVLCAVTIIALYLPLDKDIKLAIVMAFLQIVGGVGHSYFGQASREGQSAGAPISGSAPAASTPAAPSPQLPTPNS